MCVCRNAIYQAGDKLLKIRSITYQLGPPEVWACASLSGGIE